MNTHTLSAYDNELKAIKELMKQMSSAIQEQMENTLKVLHNTDVKLAAKVHKRDQKINSLRGNIEQQIVRIIALRQPVANDLRWLVSSLQIADELERMGDYADNITKHIELLENMPDELAELSERLEKMVKLVISMFSDVIESLFNNDKELAIATWKQDKEVDKLDRKLTKQYMEFMIEDNDYVEMTTKLLFVVKIVERMGDRITNIAEKIYFNITGEYLN